MQFENPLKRVERLKRVTNLPGRNTNDRVPPGQFLTEKFPVLHYGSVASYPNLDNWDFRIFGLVEAPLRFTWQELMQLPRPRRPWTFTASPAGASWTRPGPASPGANWRSSSR